MQMMRKLEVKRRWCLVFALVVFGLVGGPAFSQEGGAADTWGPTADVLPGVGDAGGEAGDDEVPEVRNYAPYPQPGSGYVTDLGDLLTLEEEERIEQWLWRTEEETGVEIAVMTIHAIADYPGTANRSIESFATGLFDAYGIGNMPANDGILLLVSVADRKARIELGAGYGRMYDREAKEIMDGVIIPQFRKGRFAKGITQGVEALAEEFAEVRLGFPTKELMYLGGLLLAVLVSFSLFKSGKRGWGWVLVGLIAVVFVGFLRMLAVMHEATSSGGGIGSSSGWSSGGFGGGFGGGFSGGGGASGGW